MIKENLWTQTMKYEEEPVLTLSLRRPEPVEEGRAARRIGRYYQRMGELWKARWETVLFPRACEALALARENSRPFQPWDASAAYTVDGGELGELEYENFNAASAKVTVHGFNIHPGSAKDKMRNALLMAIEFVDMLPPAETPAHTEGYEGFYHLNRMEGDETQAALHFIIRDHDKEKFEGRKARMEAIAAYLNGKYGPGTVDLELKDSYYNMREQIEPHMYLIHRARSAFQKAGVEAVEVPIRGGTDGARLSYMGLPCPNLSTGGANFHGVMEYIPVKTMEKMVEVLLNLVTDI